MPAGFKTFSNNTAIFPSISLQLMFNMFFSIVTDQTLNSEDKIAGFYTGLEKANYFSKWYNVCCFKTSSNNIAIFASIFFQLMFNMFSSIVTDQTLNREDKITVFYTGLEKANYFSSHFFLTNLSTFLRLLYFSFQLKKPHFVKFIMDGFSFRWTHLFL